MDSLNFNRLICLDSLLEKLPKDPMPAEGLDHLDPIPSRVYVETSNSYVVCMPGRNQIDKATVAAIVMAANPDCSMPDMSPREISISRAALITAQADDSSSSVNVIKVGDLEHSSSKPDCTREAFGVFNNGFDALTIDYPLACPTPSRPKPNSFTHPTLDQLNSSPPQSKDMAQAKQAQIQPLQPNLSLCWNPYSQLLPNSTPSQLVPKPTPSHAQIQPSPIPNLVFPAQPLGKAPVDFLPIAVESGFNSPKQADQALSQENSTKKGSNRKSNRIRSVPTNLKNMVGPFGRELGPSESDVLMIRMKKSYIRESDLMDKNKAALFIKWINSALDEKIFEFASSGTKVTN